MRIRLLLLLGLLPAEAGGQTMRPGDWTLSSGVTSGTLDLSLPPADERLTVIGRRHARSLAPLAAYGEDRTDWEQARVHKDMLTGADIAAFGNAYALSSPMGNDERSNETGGQFAAPRHN